MIKVLLKILKKISRIITRCWKFPNGNMLTPLFLWDASHTTACHNTYKNLHFLLYSYKYLIKYASLFVIHSSLLCFYYCLFIVNLSICSFCNLTRLYIRKKEHMIPWCIGFLQEKIATISCRIYILWCIPAVFKIYDGYLEFWDIGGYIISYKLGN